MTIKTSDCDECGAPAAYGRLSCPACGALLASVARGRGATARRRLAAQETIQLTGTAHVPETVEVAETVEIAETVAVAESVEIADFSSVPQTVEVAEAVDVVDAVHLTDPVVVAAADTAGIDRADHPLPGPATEAVEATEQAVGAAEQAGIIDVADVDRASVLFGAAHAERGANEAELVAEVADPEPVLVARPYTSPGAPNPAAYRPPTLTLAIASGSLPAVAPVWPSMTAAGARGQIGRPTNASAEIPATPNVVGAADFVEIGGSLVTAGAAMSGLGFLLPWSSTVVGSNALAAYFDRWGLAGPGHLLLLAGVLAVLAFGLVRTSVPAWLRSGVLGLGLGGLLLGLIWPYLVGPLGADVGVMLCTVGGVALVVGGALASWATRHVEWSIRV